jgi:very-short-patch-repair endonuclease
MKLFVSYSRDDKNEVYALAAALRDETPHDVWIDRRLVGAELWWAAILDQIEACQCFIAILTPRSAVSIYCTAELAYALALHKPVLPVLLKPCDLPPALKDVQFEDITGLSPERTLLRITQALHAVEIRWVQNMVKLPATPPDRPLPPEPEAKPEHAFELFAAAEEAFAAGDQGLAARLYQKVNEADPTGLGAEAASRLRDMRYAHSRATAYTQLERLVSNPATHEGAKAAWKVYVARYGKVYDPNGYAGLLTDPLGQTAPLSPDRLPPESTLLTTTTAKLSDYGVAVPSRPAFELPMLEWCDIPAGEVTIVDHGVYRVEAFRMAKYPVTNAQFQVFVDAPDGYADPVWWNFSEAARAWREKNTAPVESHFSDDKLPREMVSWYEAMAFCRWLSAKYQTLTPAPLPQGEGEKYREAAAAVLVQIARELRQRQTDAEATLWECLRERRLGGIKFRRQHPIAGLPYVADFFCYESQLVIEVDGLIHEGQEQADTTRQHELEALGYRVIRFRNEQILNGLESVLPTILAHHNALTPRPEGEGPGVRVIIRLPTEQEWQRAAQGDDGREYPWGNEFDETKCNTRESNIGKTTPVDRYPQGASPYGVLDMSGNVWEWCLNEYRSPDEVSIDMANRCAVRGGSWFSAQAGAQAGFRSWDSPGYRDNDLGFRVCASAPIHQRTDNQ